MFKQSHIGPLWSEVNTDKFISLRVATLSLVQKWNHAASNLFCVLWSRRLFNFQVQNAWRANASAVLVYNDRDTTLLEKMKLSTDNGRECFFFCSTFKHFCPFLVYGSILNLFFFYK